MVDEKRKVRNARCYENNKELLQKLKMDKYYANKDIIIERKNNAIMLINGLTFKFIADSNDILLLLLYFVGIDIGTCDLHFLHFSSLLHSFHNCFIFPILKL